MFASLVFKFPVLPSIITGRPVGQTTKAPGPLLASSVRVCNAQASIDSTRQSDTIYFIGNTDVTDRHIKKPKPTHYYQFPHMQVKRGVRGQQYAYSRGKCTTKFHLQCLK